MIASVANFGHINQMVKVCRAQHAKSAWRELQFNDRHVRKNLMKVVREDGVDALIVKNDDGEIQGILLASMEQFFICKEWYATDIHFMCDAGGVQLFAEFKRWAREHGATKIIMGVANDDPTGRIHKFYEMVGMRPVGDAWLLNLTESEELAA